VLNVRLPTANLRFAGFWGGPGAPACVSGPYPNESFAEPGPPATDATNRCPDGDQASSSGCTFEEPPQTPIEDAATKTSVCTQDEVDDLTCQLPIDPGASEQCTTVDACWTTPGFVFGGICALD
jgi:hypothetical protein